MIAFVEIALHFTLRSAMLYSSAVNADALYETLGVTRFVRCVVERILQRRRSDVNNQDFLRSLAFELESVGIIVLLKRSFRFRRIGREHSCPLSDCPQNLADRAGLRDND